MSEYYLADQKAEERARRRELERVEPQVKKPTESQNVKVTLLGDFMFPTSEPQGFDPYNNVQGKPMREAWRARQRR